MIAKFLEINPINPECQRKPGKSLEKIAGSMEKYGVLTLPVCVKQVINNTERYVLVDGLHRVEAAKLAGKLEELYVVVSPYTCHNYKEIIEIMKVLNTTQSPWVLSTYIHFYASCNDDFFEDYRKLETLKESTKIGYSILSVLLTGNSSSSCSKAIKNGGFSIENLKLALKAIEFFKQFKFCLDEPLTVDLQREAAYLIYSYCKDYDEFYIKKFLNYIKNADHQNLYFEIKNKINPLASIK